MGRGTRPLRDVLSAYLVDGTLSSGEGGNDSLGTLHELEARPTGRDGEPVPYEMYDHAALYR